MRILACHPGASFSTADVYEGDTAALRTLGVEVIPYALEGRIERAASWLTACWKRARRADPTLVRPTPADILYQASVGLIERVLRLQPDVLVVWSAMFGHPDVWIMLRRAGIRAALVGTEAPYDVEHEAKIAPWFDVVWTNERTSVAQLREANPHSHYLPHAFDPAKHRPFSAEDLADVPAHDVVFIGTGFQERIELLSAVDWSGIDLGLYGTWELLPARHRLRKYLRGGAVPNAEAAKLYARAKIGLNLYRSSMGFGRCAPRIQHAESLNPRALELAATGCFQVSDDRAEVQEVFQGAVPTFSHPAELEAIIRRFLADPLARDLHRQQALQAVQPHTFDARAEQVLHDLCGHS